MGGMNSGRIELAARNAEILRYWDMGKQGTQIAGLVGCSRSAVLGVVGRARKAGLVELLPDDEYLRRAQEACAKMRRNRRKRTTGRKAVGQEKQQLVQGGGDALAKVQRGECLYPHGTPGSPGFRFCRQPRALPSPYCAKHHAACNQRPAPPSDAGRPLRKEWAA